MHHSETTISRFHLRNDGILDVRAINPEVHRSPELIRTDLRVMADITGGLPRPTLWQPIATREPIPPAAFQVFVSGMVNVVSALAALVDDSTETILGGFPNAVGSLMLPVRTFRSEADALEWLARYL